jgi:hypothetical protein
MKEAWSYKLKILAIENQKENLGRHHPFRWRACGDKWEKRDLTRKLRGRHLKRNLNVISRLEKSKYG